jgi:hypothetical protein
MFTAIHGDKSRFHSLTGSLVQSPAAEYEKVATIDLAKRRLSAAQEWRSLGVF